jgi:alpha-tubulin suppressor-like RCC1 family protein
MDVVEIAVGLNHYLMRRSDNTIWGWGGDSNGALGDGEENHWGEGISVQVLTIDDAVAIDAKVGTVCTVRSDGSVWCWGNGEEGQCGPPGGLGFECYEPHHIDGVNDAVDVQVGGSHACALRATGEVVCWGMDGTRGDGAEYRGDAYFTTSAAPVPGLTDVVVLEAGSYGNCAVVEGGELWCWGAYQTWDAPEYHTPRHIDEVSDVVDVAVGALVGDYLGTLGGHLCVLERCGRVRCWGRNDLGQNGDGTTDDSRTPVDVLGLP